MRTLYAFKNSTALVGETYQYLQKAKNHNANIEQLKKQWAQSALNRLKVHLKVTGTPSASESLLFVGNHISYLDIPLLLHSAPRLCFVAKQEVSSWPIFGEAARKIETVFVKRENQNSRQSARSSILAALKAGKRIVLFPSGTTCLNENKVWRKGAFEIAQESNSWIQPFRIAYKPLRTVAYIDDDFFPAHLYQLFRENRIQAEIEFHEPVQITDPQKDCSYWQHWSRGLFV